MSDLSATTDLILSRASAWSKIARHSTGYGYQVTRSRPVRLGIDGIEASVAFAGYIGVLMTAGLWALPGSLMAASVLGIKMGLSLAFGLTGLSLVQLAGRGLKRELHVDRKRAQLRVVWRNRKGETRLETVMGFDEIGSLFLRRGAISGGRTQLFVRVDTIKAPIELFSGSEHEMQGLWTALNEDLRTTSTPKVTHPTLFSVTPCPKPRLVHSQARARGAITPKVAHAEVLSAELAHRTAL